VINVVLATMESLEREGKQEPPGKDVNLQPVRQTVG